MERKLPDNYIREIKIILSYINKLELDLSGLTIVTEVGSGNYILSPLIPLLAGAKKVYAWTVNSQYGQAEEIIKNCRELVQKLDLKERLIFHNGSINTNHLNEADIVTNSGFLRPLDYQKLQYLNSKCVIPLMYEKWELRESDIDIEYCKKNNIKVAGTWENHPDIEVFTGVGPLAIKLILESGLEVYQNNIFIWSDDHFGSEAKKAMINFGASKVLLSNDSALFYSELENLDTLYICDYDEKRNYFGDEGLIDLDKILKVNPSLNIVHLFGELSYDYLKNTTLNVYPKKNGKASLMTETLAYLGPSL
ncbi:hypothetical protein, partial [Fulvivirga lutimaris]|uniref:hypothetical protein n=1 Tax=Fulvivirga lutimaris TaxID=1819566 RepID=UPI0012BC338B